MPVHIPDIPVPNEDDFEEYKNSDESNELDDEWELIDGSEYEPDLSEFEVIDTAERAPTTYRKAYVISDLVESWKPTNWFKKP